MRLQLRDKFLRNSERIGEELSPKAVRHELRDIAGLPRASAGWQHCRAAFARWLALPASFIGASLPPAISRIDTFAASRVLRYLHYEPNKPQTWRDGDRQSQVDAIAGRGCRRRYLLREGLAVLLERSGFEIVGLVGNAAGLMALVRDKSPELVIVDIRMPPTNTTEGLKPRVRSAPNGLTPASWCSRARPCGACDEAFSKRPQNRLPAQEPGH